MGQILFSVFDASSPIFPTGIDEIKRLSIILIQLRFPVFGISRLNIQLLKGKVSLATRDRRTRLIGTFHTFSLSFSRPAVDIRVVLPENHSKHHAVYFQI
jgi:hypothetical protein